ncbi:MAG: 2-amino-4-hydroxy-6-hydroxymethyldihydropteridine diphosphokinase [Rhodoferax sp.]|nr:2-amino-4-hydroxy-6-hydroxymethyldihydropteridine diphosphokinase [Rhodoferax sp.]MDD2882405.1 2-amino-4-hydroxy-6-hydroxymethyldihydropteridine diphosphokinase [Rhodoferax sp.]
MTSPGNGLRTINVAGAGRTEVLAFIALGGNMGDAPTTVRTAITQVAAMPQTRLVSASGLYRSAPVDASGPDFVNAVIGVQTHLNAHELLMQLQHLETLAGRKRPYLNAPRTLDLDLLLYGDARIDSPQLVVPHPRMMQRAFVLVPLAEIAPHCVTAEQLRAVVGQEIHRFDESQSLRDGALH